MLDHSGSVERLHPLACVHLCWCVCRVSQEEKVKLTCIDRMPAYMTVVAMMAFMVSLWPQWKIFFSENLLVGVSPWHHTFHLSLSSFQMNQTLSLRGRLSHTYKQPQAWTLRHAEFGSRWRRCFYAFLFYVTARSLFLLTTVFLFQQFVIRSAAPFISFPYPAYCLWLWASVFDFLSISMMSLWPLT